MPLRNVFNLLAKSVLILLGLTAGASEATEAAFHKKMCGSGAAKLIISNEKMNDIVKWLSLLKNLVC